MSQAGIINTLDAGGGDVVGPGSAIDGDIAVFDGTTGKLIRDSLVHISNIAATFGTISISHTASSGTGYSVSNLTNAAAAGAYFAASALGGDALINFNAFTNYQIGSKASDGNLYVTTTPAGNNQLGGVNLMKFETINNVNFGKGRITTFGAQVVCRKPVPANSVVMNNEDYYIGVTSTAAPRTIQLPGIATVVSGQIFVIKDESGGAAANNITVEPLVTDVGVTIDGAATYVISSNYGSIQLITDGSNFFIY